MRFKTERTARDDGHRALLPAQGHGLTWTLSPPTLRAQEKRPSFRIIVENAIMRLAHCVFLASGVAIASIVGLLDSVHGCLEAARVDHALIGAFALAAWGVQRATNDVDLLIDGAKVMAARQALESAGFTVFHVSDEVLQMTGPGPVDFVLARRPLSLAMLARASGRTFRGIKCVEPEDLIGLKIQAYKNDPRRELQDRADIQRLIEVSPSLDWARIKQYADLFSEWPAVNDLRRRAGRNEP